MYKPSMNIEVLWLIVAFIGVGCWRAGDRGILFSLLIHLKMIKLSALSAVLYEQIFVLKPLKGR